METINNITSAASKVIWGENAESGVEPRSGEQGKGSLSDPYDHGNEEQQPEDSNTKSTTTTTTTTNGNMNQPPSSGVDTTENRSGPSEAVSDSHTGDPKSGQAPEQKQQGADRPKEEPTSGNDSKIKVPHTDEEREEAMKKGEFPHDPNDHSGEPLKMHGGGEGGEENSQQQKKERSESVAQEGGDPHGASKGTGTEYVKSSGMAADGGDFDATKPGAGAEANRLLEEKGIHKSEGNRGPVEKADDDTNGTPKVSKMDKLKEKLHIKH